jgi:hypothetical protein hcinC1_02841
MKTINFALLGVILFGLSGCVNQPVFRPTQLSNEARGIALASSSPYNCYIIGEVEGRSETEIGAENADMESLRASALNDAKNKAFYIAGISHRIMLREIAKEAICFQNGDTFTCNKKRPAFIKSYTIRAEIFDCNAK